jgi:hypothetical protein
VTPNKCSNKAFIFYIQNAFYIGGGGGGGFFRAKYTFFFLSSKEHITWQR